VSRLAVYLSGRFALAPDLARAKLQLEAVGLVCTARWLDGDLGGARVMAAIDFDDVKRSHALVAWADAPVEFSPHKFAARGGRHVEVGLALAWGIPVYVVGPRENVFHHLTPERAPIFHFPTWPEVLERLVDADTLRTIESKTFP
jgi:hypothetical protein